MLLPNWLESFSLVVSYHLDDFLKFVDDTKRKYHLDDGFNKN
jgi:hypothetical protein